MSKFRRIVSILLEVIFCATIMSMVVGCSANSRQENKISVTDMLGEKVKVKKCPEKVACVSRTTYDLLIAFGLGDYIDGVYSPVLDNEWTTKIYPSAKNHYRYKYNEGYETFIMRGVDLVFAPEKYIADGLKEHGITAMNVSLYGNPSFDNYVYYFADLVKELWGEIDGVNDKVDEWKAEFETAKTAITTELDKHTISQKSIYYVRGDSNKGLGYTDTGKSFTEYVYKKIFGLKYIGSTFETNKPSAEAICSANPDFIAIGGIYQNTLINLAKTDNTYKNLNAVKSDKVFNIPVGLSMFEQISAFSPIFIYDQANKLFPEYFNFDVKGLLKNSCSKYFALTLSDNELQNMLNGLSPEGESLV